MVSSILDLAVKDDLFQKAKVQLILNHPFWGVLVLHMPTVAVHPAAMILAGAPPTAGVDGDNIYYCKAWVESLSEPQRMGLLAHEVMHPALGHLWRRGARDPKVFREACDHVVNLLLQKSGFQLPEGGLWSDEFEGMSAEQVYDVLIKRPKKEENKPMDGHLERKLLGSGGSGGSGKPKKDKKGEKKDEKANGGGKGKDEDKDKDKDKQSGGQGPKPKPQPDPDEGDEGDEGDEPDDERDGEQDRGKNRSNKSDKGDKSDTGDDGDDGDGGDSGDEDGGGGGTSGDSDGEGESNKQEEGEGDNFDRTEASIDECPIKESDEEKWRNLLVQAAMVAKARGTLPAGMDRLVEDTTEPKVPWQQVLERFVNDVMHDDYDMMKRDRRFNDVYLPDLQNDTASIAVAVDTSGSIGGDELKAFVGEVRGILTSRGVSKMRLMCCDADLNLDVTLQPTDDVPTNFPGGGGCYDEQTELLTLNGWKFFRDVRDDEIAATLNPRSGLEYQKITAIVNRPYSGRMIRIKGGGFGRPRIDLLVTPEHNMWVETGRRHRGSWERLPAEALPEIFKLSRTAAWKGSEEATFLLPGHTKTWKRRQDTVMRSWSKSARKIRMDPWLEFLGLYFAEGSILSGRTVEIPQVSKVKECRRILNALPFENTFEARGGRSRFRIYSAHLASYLTQFGLAHQKSVPEFVKNLSSRQIRLFLRGYTVGDGHVGKYEKREWSTVSKRLADDVLELLLKTGSSGTYYPIPAKGNRKTKYNVRECKKAVFRLRRSRYVTEESYDGRIYCVEVPNHVLYVRRNGIPVWCGNTDFRPVFKKLLEDIAEKPACVIYLTDMDGCFPEEDPGLPTIWLAAVPAYLNNEQFEQYKKGPFGTTIRYEWITHED